MSDPTDDEVEPLAGCGVCLANKDKGWKEFCIGSYDWKWLCMPRPPWASNLKPPPFFKRDEAQSILIAVVMGFQHALAMMGGLITPPTLIAGDGCLFNRDPKMCDKQQYLISASLLASGILTLVQVMRIKLCGGYYIGTGLISVMGTSFTFLPIAREVTANHRDADGNLDMVTGYGKFLGTVLVASLLEIALSFIPPQKLRKLFPPVVTGTCVTLIGAALSGTGMKYWGGGVFCAENQITHAGPWALGPNRGPKTCGNGVGILGDNGTTNYHFGDWRYVGLGFLVLVFIYIYTAFGSPFMKNCNIMLALFTVYFISMGIGSEEEGYFVVSNRMDNAPWGTFLWVETFPIGFSSEAFLPVLIGFLVSTIESIGDIKASCDASRIPDEGKDADSRVQGGLLADGVNSFLAALFTCAPNTTFSQNNGVIELTRNASLSTGFACAGWLIFFGIFGKFAGIITTIPICVLGGMVIFLFSNVAVSGIAILGRAGITRRDRLILAISLGVGIGVACQPNVFDPAPSSPAAFYGVNLGHNIGFWPKKAACTEWYTTTSTTTVPSSCLLTNSTGGTITSSLDEAACAYMSGAFTAAVSTSVTTSNKGKLDAYGNAEECNAFGNCCKKYDGGGSGFRSAILLILKTPYCIGTLLALLLNLILPTEKDDEEDIKGIELKHKTDGVSSTAAPVDISSS